MTRIETVTKTDIGRLISSTTDHMLSDEEGSAVKQCAKCTTTVWVAYVDDELVAIWGLVPPTLLSDCAYLWMHSTDKVKDHEFIVVRRSQQAIEKILKIYPKIVGHCDAKASRSIRWLKWLGAVFAEPEGKYVPFLIEAHNG